MARHRRRRSRLKRPTNICCRLSVVPNQRRTGVPRWFFFLIGFLAFWLWAAPAQARKWEKLEGCELLPNRANDGDSFHTRHGKTEYLFRLYFVDAPETDDSFPERVKEQAEYFNVSTKVALKLGKDAEEFTAAFLRHGFTVYTQFDDARGRSRLERFYAIVKVDKQELAEELVRQGLARVFGMHTELPDGLPARQYETRLKRIEREAQKEKHGAWSYAAGVKYKAETPEDAGQEAAPPKELVSAATITVYSVVDSRRVVGLLPKGRRVQVVGEESTVLVRIRFQNPAGQWLEVLCRKSDLGLPVTPPPSAPVSKGRK